MRKEGKVIIRSFQQEDALALRAVFYSAVRFLACQDYSLEQIAVWATDEYDFTLWREKMCKLKPFIAEIDGVIAGYADVQQDGLIDHFFVAVPYARKGVGSALMSQIVECAKRRDIALLYSYVSITARPFFSHWGFEIKESCSATMRGITLNNYLMQKEVNLL